MGYVIKGRVNTNHFYYFLIIFVKLFSKNILIMNWVMSNCSCNIGLHCIRPEYYSKPTLCIPANVGPDDFIKFITEPKIIQQANFGSFEALVLYIILICVVLSFGFNVKFYIN